MIYIVLTVFTIVTAFFMSNNRSESLSGYNDGIITIDPASFTNRLKLIVFELPMILISGLRYGISIDYLPMYEKGFYQVMSGGKPEYETGFIWFNKLCIAICKEPWFMFLLVSTITIVLFVNCFWKYSKDFFLSIVLFFALGIYFDTFNGIRQYVAVALFVWSIQYIEKRKIFKYIITILVGSLFHTSVLFFLPVYFLINLNISFKLWGCVLILIYIIRNNIFEIFKTLISYNSKYILYITRNTLSRNTSFTSSGLISSIVAFLPFFILLVENKHPFASNDVLSDDFEICQTKSNIGTFFMNMNMLGISIALISGILPMADRILYYFKGMYLVSIPFAINQLNISGKTRIIPYLVIGLLGGMTVLGIIFLDWYAIIPYKSIFNK